MGERPFCAWLRRVGGNWHVIRETPTADTAWSVLTARVRREGCSGACVVLPAGTGPEEAEADWALVVAGAVRRRAPDGRTRELRFVKRNRSRLLT